MQNSKFYNLVHNNRQIEFRVKLFCTGDMRQKKKYQVTALTKFNNLESVPS